MSGAGGVDDQGLGIRHIGQVGEQLQTFDELLAACKTSLNPKGEDGARPLGAVLLGQRMIRAVRQAGVVNSAYLLMII